MGNIGPMELIVVMVIALIFFGPKKLPEIGRGIGSALREFKKASRDLMSHFDADEYEPPRTYPAATAPVSEPPEETEPAPILPPGQTPSNTHPTSDRDEDRDAVNTAAPGGVEGVR
jgi:sec-independent protein translocase protein TatA